MMDKAKKILGYNITRMSEYEGDVYTRWIYNLRYVLEWSSTDSVMYKIASNMAFIWGVAANNDICIELSKRHLSSQNIKSFPWKKLKYFMSLEPKLKAMKKELAKSKNKDHRLNSSLFPTLSKHELELKSFCLFGHRLNDLLFVQDGTVCLSDFGKMEDIFVETMREDICRQLDTQRKNEVYCCGEPYDKTQNYIECSSKHPLCPQWIHQKCAKLTVRKFNSFRFSSKKYICPCCKRIGFTKPLTREQISQITSELMEASKAPDPSSILSFINRQPAAKPEATIKPTKISNKLTLDAVLSQKYPRQQSNKKKKEIEQKNESYSDARRHEVWKHCVQGMVGYIESLIFNMFGGDGLFNKKQFKQYIVWHVKDILDTNAWFDIDVEKPLNDRKRKEYIKKKLVDDKKIESIASIYQKE
eukprot:248775_1